MSPFLQSPFFVLSLPTVVFVFLALRLREPTRGVHERLAAGADATTAEIEEVPAGFNETFRTLFNLAARASLLDQARNPPPERQVFRLTLGSDSCEISEMSQVPDRTDVLVVGAGPVGLGSLAAHVTSLRVHHSGGNSGGLRASA